MSGIQKILITLGVFWLSIWVAAAIGWPLGKVTNGFTYSDGIFDAFKLAVFNSLGRTIAAILAGVLITIVVSGPKSQLWALILGILYLIDAPVRFRWSYPATSWDRLWQGVALLLPAVACVAAAFVTARLQRNRALEDT